MCDFQEGHTMSVSEEYLVTYLAVQRKLFLIA